MTDFKKEEVIDSTCLYFFYVCPRITPQRIDRFWWSLFLFERGRWSHATLHQHWPNIFPILVNHKDYCHPNIIILCTFAHISSACWVNIYKTKKLKLKKKFWSKPTSKNKIALKSEKLFFPLFNLRLSYFLSRCFIMCTV